MQATTRILSLLLAACSLASCGRSKSAADNQSGLIRLSELSANDRQSEMNRVFGPTARLDTTDKGNTWLTIGDVAIQIEDWHDDGEVYDTGWLLLKILVGDHDTIQEYVFLGVVNVTNDKLDTVDYRVPVALGITYSASSGHAEVQWSHGMEKHLRTRQ